MNMLQELSEHMNKHFERMNKQIDKHFGEVRESLRDMHGNFRESLQIMQESNLGEKGEIELEDAKEQPETKDNHPIEVSTSVPEEVHVTAIRETKETEISAVELSERHGERNAPNKPDVDVKMAEETNHSKPRKSHVKGLAAAGASRKKKSRLVKKKLEGLKKNAHGKSQKEAFQAWLDQVRKKPREQTNKVRQQTTEMQRYVPWDPGGFIYETRSSQVPDHRSQYPVREITTSTPIEATNQDLSRRLHS
jgi:hypothetical protein